MLGRKNNNETSLSPSSFQISICDDYSLPVDFVNKKRPSSFDPCLAESIPNNWTSTAVTAAAAGASVAATATSPLSDHVRIDNVLFKYWTGVELLRVNGVGQKCLLKICFAEGAACALIETVDYPNAIYMIYG